MNTDEPWLSDQQQHAWRTWLQVGSDLEVVLARALNESSEISYTDFMVLVALTDDPAGQVRITDLAAGLNWERSRVSHQVKRMQTRGLVCRSDCSEDGRVAYVAVTDRGRTAIADAAPEHARLVRQLVFDGLTEEELACFVQVQEKIQDALARHATGSLTRA